MFSTKESHIRGLLNYLDAQSRIKTNCGDVWGIDTDRTDSDTVAINEIHPYERTFASLLTPFTCFAALAHARRQEGQSAYFLDLFGSGKFVAESGQASGVVGIRSKDIMTPEEVAARPPSWEIIEGNIYELYPGRSSQHIWDRLGEYYQRQGIRFFDIITCRPIGPFEHDMDNHFPFQTPAYLAVYYQLFRAFYSLLTPYDGYIFTNLPNLNGSVTAYSQFQAFLRDCGCEVVLDQVDAFYLNKKDTVMRLRKTPDSLRRLPETAPCIEIV